jgi:NAD(P)-dependent dehydrogenase (short-subunit alcohol dehydrogenase family)
VTQPLALVTGGVRRLGAVIAARLAAAGYALALTSHSDGEPDDVLAEALRQHATDWQHFPADLSDGAAPIALVKAVIAHFGRAPVLLVNNAAMFGQDGWQDMDSASLDAHFRLNLFAPLLLAKAVVEAADGITQAAIVHIVDQRIANPNGDQLSYTLSKQALAASVRSMASAFGQRARVNAVAPGLVIPTEDYDDAQMERLNAEMPLGALPSAHSVADAVLFLAQAKDTSGQIIFADGGAHLKSFARDFLHL